MANKEIKATAKLFLDTKNAQNDAKQFVNDIKQKLSSIETAADKMTVFKDLVGYIGQVDKALTALRNKNKLTFDHVFDRVDTGLRKNIEEILGVTKNAMTTLDTLRQKVNNATENNTSKDDLKAMESEVKSLYGLIGQDAPISGRGKFETRITAMKNAIIDFATVFEDSISRIQNGFNFDGASGDTGLTKLIDSAQKKVDELTAKIEQYKSLLNDIKKLSEVKSAYDEGDDTNQFGIAKTADEVVELLNNYKQLKVTLDSVKQAEGTSSISYYKTLIEYAKTATKLYATQNQASSKLTKELEKQDFTDRDLITSIGLKPGDVKKKNENGKYDISAILSQLTYNIGEFFDELNVQFDAGMSSVFEKEIKNFQSQIEAITADTTNYVKTQETKSSNSVFSGNSGQADINKKIALSYDELSNKLTEYISLQKKANDGIEFDDDGKSIVEKIEEYDNYFDSLAKTKEDLDKIQTITEDLSFGDISLDEALTNLCNILKIDIPNGAQEASSTATTAFAKITQEANQAANSSQKVMYHLGNLLNGKGKAQDTFGDMTDNLTTNVAGTKYEKYGYGVFGGGLFGVTDPSSITQRPGRSNFIQSIDISKYNMYMADTEERAEALADFLSKLQKFSMKQAEPNYTGFDSYLQGVDIDSLYNQFKIVFEQSDLTKEKLQTFIDEMVALLQQAGLAFDAQTDSLDFTNISKEIAGSENISTRFMKMLGFEGVNTGTTSFGGLGQGSVLFDFEKVDIVGYFESVKSAIQDYQNLLNQTDGKQWVGSTEQLQQYASNIDAIINKLQEYKNTGLLKDTSELDETLSKLTQIKENIGNILSGKDISGNSPFETITTGVKTAETSVEQAETKLQDFLDLANEAQGRSFDLGSAEANVEIGAWLERLDMAKAELEKLGTQGLFTAEQLRTIQDAFNESKSYLKDSIVLDTSPSPVEELKKFLALSDEIKNTDFIGDATVNVDIGKYIERLNSAKVTLEELGSQGLITASQLDQVRTEFDSSMTHLELRKSYYTGYGSGYGNYSYSYFDEYEDEKARADALEEENRAIKEQLNTKPQADINEQSSEISQLEQLKAKLAEVREAVDAKTNAFKEEGSIVTATINEEAQALQSLLTQLQEVLTQVNLISESFTKANAEIAELKNVKDVDRKDDITSEAVAEKASETMSQNYALDSTLLTTNRILENILVAIGNNESFSQLVEPLNAAIVELKSVASGIVEHQKAQQTDRSAASTKIANNYGQLSSIATNTVASLGDEVQIKQMRALADGVVKVEGAVKNADGVWQGFIVDINESNNAVIRAVDKQSAFAKALNESAEAAKKAESETKKQESPKEDKFTKDLTNQKNALKDYKDSLKDVDYLNDELNNKLSNLGTSLDNVVDSKELEKWKGDFQNVKDEVSVVQEVFNRLETEKLKGIRNNLNSEFKTLDFTTTANNPTAEQQEILNLRKQLITEIEKQTLAVERGKNVELSSINTIVTALKQKINAYRDANDLASGSGQKFGSTAVLNATAKFNSLKQRANSDEFVNSQVVQQALSQYEAAFYNKLIKKRKELAQVEKNGITDTQKSEFKRLQVECNDAAKALDKIITKSKELEANGIAHGLLGDDFEDSVNGRKAALQDFVEATYGASAKIGDFKNNFNQLTFAVDNGDGTFTEMTASINAARTAIDATAGTTQKATGAFESFINEVKGKFKSISAYLISMVGIQEVWQQIRQGVTYVKEIDSALTELKKVTDETDQTYQDFLQTASQTASVIGSNVADFTNATADFARLEYSIDEAANLAKSASVYKNVGDGIEDVSQASESIISTMKAFGIEANDAMGIVDRFNEVGNNFAISSTGIGEAMQRSASALYEAGNTIDESIGLVTAAM